MPAASDVPCVPDVPAASDVTCVPDGHVKLVDFGFAKKCAGVLLTCLPHAIPGLRLSSLAMAGPHPESSCI